MNTGPIEVDFTGDEYDGARHTTSCIGAIVIACTGVSSSLSEDEHDDSSGESPSLKNDPGGFLSIWTRLPDKIESLVAASRSHWYLASSATWVVRIIK
jgi:hypothetical protein